MSKYEEIPECYDCAFETDMCWHACVNRCKNLNTCGCNGGIGKCNGECSCKCFEAAQPHAHMEHILSGECSCCCNRKIRSDVCSYCDKWSVVYYKGNFGDNFICKICKINNTKNILQLKTAWKFGSNQNSIIRTLPNEILNIVCKFV